MRLETVKVIITDSEFEVLIKVSNIPNSIGYYYDGVKYNDGFGIQTLQILPIR